MHKLHHRHLLIGLLVIVAIEWVNGRLSPATVFTDILVALLILVVVSKWL